MLARSGARLHAVARSGARKCYGRAVAHDFLGRCLNRPREKKLMFFFGVHLDIFLGEHKQNNKHI